jgi:hypothetical protein
MIHFDVIAGLASILGFVASVAAVIQAGRASRAATQARDAILIRTLVDEFQTACNRMDELLDLVLHDRLAEAHRVARELTSMLSEIPYRRSPYLSVERKNELLNVRTQVQVIEHEIPPHPAQSLTAKKKQSLIQVCRQGSQTLRENLGTIKGQVEFGGGHGRAGGSRA